MASSPLGAFMKITMPVTNPSKPLSYQTHSRFSNSGTVVLDRGGVRVVGIITGGSSPADGIDIKYLTPHWWLKEQVQAKFPGRLPYEAVK